MSGEADLQLAGLDQRNSDLGAHYVGHFVRAAVEFGRERLEDAAPFLGRSDRPRLEGIPGSGDGRVDVGRRRRSHFGDGLFRCRVDDAEPLGTCGLGELTVDKLACIGDHSESSWMRADLGARWDEMMSAVRQPIIMVARFVVPRGSCGMTEASAT